MYVLPRSCKRKRLTSSQLTNMRIKVILRSSLLGYLFYITEHRLLRILRDPILLHNTSYPPVNGCIHFWGIANTYIVRRNAFVFERSHDDFEQCKCILPLRLALCLCRKRADYQWLQSHRCISSSSWLGDRPRQCTRLSQGICLLRP